MGQIYATPKALLFQGITYNNPKILNELEPILVNKYGPVYKKSQPYTFSERTPYYEKEMGSPLWKTYYIFEKIITLESVYQYKIDSNELENLYSRAGQRTVNIDPGVLTLYNFSLLTTKGFSHRIYLKKGIYSEVTLIVKGQQFDALPWSYPDYLRDEVLDLLLDSRLYLKKISK